MAQGDVSDQELADLVERTAQSASALIRGEMRTYADLVPHADDFRGGECELEVEASYTSGDLVVLVAVERQHGVVGGGPEQDWSLRVTLVWRRVGTGWELVHRHADPLVHPIDQAQLSALAAGPAGG